MRFVIGVVAIVSLLPAPGSCRPALLPPPSASPLRMGVHVRDSVSLYSPRYEGGDWESNFGVTLKLEIEDQLGAAFSRVESLPSFPPAAETPQIDVYVVVEQAVARFYGKGSLTAEAQTTVSLFNAAREPAKDIQVSS